MKKYVVIAMLIIIGGAGLAQRPNLDSMKQVLAKAPDDSLKLQIISSLVTIYFEYNPDSSIYYANRILEWGRAHKDSIIVGRGYGAIAYALYTKGAYALALRNAFQKLRRTERVNDKEDLANTYNLFGNIYKGQQNYPKAVHYYTLCKETAQSINDERDLQWAYMNLAYAYEEMDIFDSAFYYCHQALTLGVRASQTTFFDYCYYTLGNLYFKKANYDSALYYYRLSEHLAAEIRPKQTALIYVSLARYYNKMAQPDSALYYAKKGLAIAERVLSTKSTYESAEMLAHIYEQKHEVDSAFVYLKLSNGLKDSLFNVAKSQEIENLATNEIIRELELESTQAAYKSKLRFYGLTALLFVALIVAFLLWRNNNNRRQAFEMLQEQKRTIETQKAKVETTLEELKITQRQLIQSEKMASLGELTAGIAHEIQNPLNFVNNFSEVSKELLVEMKDELETGNTADAKEIAADVIENLEKILHHGKRADAIVKGMLQHSRSSSGQKEATDINKLADEYLRLAYHGLRAKDKSFNATMKTDFDETIETIKVVPQDIGRAMLNLITNAFYTVAEKKKQQPDGYEPIVSVSTKKLNNTVEIEVADNGNGIPQKVWDKIFQPFFTTKPTGEGTGLGLSLSYDIVKAHGGELKVESKEGLGAVFVVTLPVDSSIPV